MAVWGLGPCKALQAAAPGAHRPARPGSGAVAAFVQVRRLQDLGRFGPRLLAASWVMLMTLVVVSAAKPHPVVQAVFCDGKGRAFAQKVRTALWPSGHRVAAGRAQPSGAGTRIGGLRAGMQGIRSRAIGKLALTMAQVAFQGGHIALWGQGGGIGSHAAGLALVPRPGSRHWGHLLAHAPCKR